jgi:hypothetical protein
LACIRPAKGIYTPIPRFAQDCLCVPGVLTASSYQPTAALHLPETKLFNNFHPSIIFAPQQSTMDYRQEEYQEELQKVQDRDFTHNWVSSSAFIFYLSVFCLLAFLFGSCYSLYTQSYEKERIETNVQGSTQYTPKYK